MESCDCEVIIGNQRIFKIEGVDFFKMNLTVDTAIQITLQ